MLNEQGKKFEKPINEPEKMTNNPEISENKLGKWINKPERPSCNKPGTKDRRPRKPGCKCVTDSSAGMHGSIQEVYCTGNSNTVIANEIIKLYDALLDCVKMHLAVLSASHVQHVSDAAEQLLTDIVKLRIHDQTGLPTNAVVKLKTGSDSAMKEKPEAARLADDIAPEKSKEEIIAERKAKAAEAKARKAAAKAKKKAEKEFGNDAKTEQMTKQQRTKRNELASKIKEQVDTTDGTLLPQATLKPAIVDYSRAPGPFRRVHFASNAEERSETKAAEKPAVGYMGDADDELVQDMTSRTPQHAPVAESSTSNVHPAFLQFAERCEERRMIGIDAICVGFIATFADFLDSYTVSADQNMSRDLEQAMRPQLSYLTDNGLHSFPLALGNLIRQLKRQVLELPPDISESDGKEQLKEWLENYQNVNFTLALESISSFCISKLQNIPCLLTYSWCPVIKRIIWDACDSGLHFRVCIIDSQEAAHGGLQLAKLLSEKGIECSYGTFTAIDYLVRKCRIVLLGCSAIFKNGFVVADRGSSQVALVASSYNIPVLVAAQSCKFVDKVRSFSHDFHEVNALERKRQETIPADLITAIVTEIRILPPSSAPAVLKSKKLEI